MKNVAKEKETQLPKSIAGPHKLRLPNSLNRRKSQERVYKGKGAVPLGFLQVYIDEIALEVHF